MCFNRKKWNSLGNVCDPLWMLRPQCSEPMYKQRFHPKYDDYKPISHSWHIFMLLELKLLTLCLWHQSLEAFCRGHMSTGCCLHHSSSHPDHPHSPGLRCTPETGWYTDLRCVMCTVKTIYLIHNLKKHVKSYLYYNIGKVLLNIRKCKKVLQQLRQSGKTLSKT